MSDCIRWTGAHTSSGYGAIKRNGKIHVVHKYYWEQANGPVPADMQLDHVKARGCRYRDCYNLDHLEVVTPAENIRRGDTGKARGAQQKAKTHCPKGHEYTPENTAHWGGKPYRWCRKCDQNRSKKNGSTNKG